MDVQLRPNPQRAARILLLAAILFFCGELVVGVFLDTAPFSVRFPEAAAVLERARKQNPPPDIVFFGSSRFMSAIAPAEIDQQLRASHGEGIPVMLPMAVLGGDFVSTEFLLDRMLAEGVRPRMAVIEVSPDLVGRPPHLVTAQLERLFRWRDVVYWLPELFEADWSALLTARLIPAYHYRRELLGWLVGRPPPYLFVPRPELPAGPAPGAQVAGSASKGLPTGTGAADSHPTASETPDDPTHGVDRWARWLRRFRISQRCADVLERVLARCQQEQITCILVEPPVASGHRALYGTDVVIPYDSLLERFGRDYGAAYLDFRDRLPDTSFRDDSHVNRTGALRFSALLASALIEPLWFGDERGTAAITAPLAP
ncbi:MAG TPA: hypothetical protein DEP35_09995 [Deltaproteobacteria bacterium]|jgi:hypothetical protein|nr:hypothetical protein [Deltaproteobacteria bacterium]